MSTVSGPAGRFCLVVVAAMVTVVPASAPNGWAGDALGVLPAVRGAMASVAVAPGSYTGLGFDACAAPSTETMQAWLASPYRAIGIYIGGINRGCTQPNLTASWVSTQQAAGWHLMPLYMGLQAPCTTSNKRYRIEPARAAAQGKAEADDAANQAAALGLSLDSVVINDMEAYQAGNAACRTAVLSYEGAWTAQLHQRGYLSGFYSSLSSGVADQVAAYNTLSYNRPDYLDFARWDGVVTVSEPTIPSNYWGVHRRIKQYQGGHDETWGGVTINIDNDYLDVAPLPRTPFGDFNGNGWSDVITRQSTTGRLYLYSGNGVGLGAAWQIGIGWNGMNAIVRYGDFNRDGYEDIIAREASTGYLWLYRWSGSGFLSRLRIGTGWNAMRELTAAGDLNRDGYPDLLAVNSSTGVLYLYPGRGTGFGTRVQVGTGWNSMDELVGIGDADRDGRVDLYARLKSTGDLYFYPGKTSGVGFGTRQRIGTGWSGMRDLTGVGDMNRDGYPDLVAVGVSNGGLYRYLGRGPLLGSTLVIGSSWSANRPLL
jgi:glycoside hydrolase-like protein/VCBS repeat protein